MKYQDLIDKKLIEDGSVPIINNLMHKSPIIEDANIMACNKGDTHTISVVTGLSDVAWGRLYKGIPASKGARAQVTESTGFMQGRCEVDTRLLDLCKDGSAKATLRTNEAIVSNEAMAQEFTKKFFYGSLKTDPDQVRGLADRYGVIATGSHPQVIDAGGTGSDNTSIWFIGWGDTKTSVIYPDGIGVGAGIKREDKGEQRTLDDNGDPYFVKEEVFTQHMGISVANYRHVVRIANIDVSELKAGNVDLYSLLSQGYYRLGDRSGDYKIYANTDVFEALDAQEIGNNTTGNANRRLRFKEIEGKEVTMYRQFQARELDPYILLNTEARVIAEA